MLRHRAHCTLRGLARLFHGVGLAGCVLQALLYPGRPVQFSAIALHYFPALWVAFC